MEEILTLRMRISNKLPRGEGSITSPVVKWPLVKLKFRQWQISFLLNILRCYAKTFKTVCCNCLCNCCKQGDHILNKRNSIWNKILLIFIINNLVALSFHILTPTLPKVYLISWLFIGYSRISRHDVYYYINSDKSVCRKYSGSPKRGILIVSLILISVAIFGYSKSNTVSAPYMLLAATWNWVGAYNCRQHHCSRITPEDKLGRGIGIFGIGSSLASAIALILRLVVDTFSFTVFQISSGLAIWVA